jgi:hypothetical protein
VRRPDIRAMLDIYRVGDSQGQELLRLADKSREVPWWHKYKELSFAPFAGLEAEAETVSQYAALIVPGLLQTEAYGAEILRAIHFDAKPEELQRRLQLRMDRQALLSEPESPRHRVVLDEAVLRRSVGGREVMHAQLERLIDLAALPNVTLQVLPFTAGAHAGMDGAFTILTYGEPEDPDVVFIEHIGGDAYIEDFDLTRQYNQTFEHLLDAALNPGESSRILAKVERELRKP